MHSTIIWLIDITTLDQLGIIESSENPTKLFLIATRRL